MIPECQIRVNMFLLNNYIMQFSAKKQKGKPSPHHKNINSHCNYNSRILTAMKEKNGLGS